MLAVTLRRLEEHNHIVGDIPRGVKLYERGGIEFTEFEPNYFVGRVPHKNGTTKTVSVTFTDDGLDIEHHFCDCSRKSKNPPICRHVVAAILAIQGGNIDDPYKPLIDFLIRAKKATYAGKGAESTPSRPSSHDFEYAEEPFAYRDTYLGGTKFAGEEAVWRNGVPVWAMNYVGRVIGEGFSGDFLKEALLLVPHDIPFRGPRQYKNGDYTYTCTVKGGFHWVHGFEEIHYNDTKVYECAFHGSDIE